MRKRLNSPKAHSHRTYTAVVEKEGKGFVALCPELDVVSQGRSVEEARANLREAVTLFLGCASPQEIEEHLHKEISSPMR